MNLTIKDIRTPVALIGLMLATRFHHFGGALSLPDASLAVFFFAGLWVRGWKFFGLLLIEAGLIDYLSITQFNVSDYCISPAYVFLIPTYASLWFAGVYCKKYSAFNVSDLLTQFVVLLIATSVAFAISNGSFYLLSGKFDVNWLEYSLRVAKYYPSYLAYTLVYAVIVYALVKLISVVFSTSLTSTLGQAK